MALTLVQDDTDTAIAELRLAWLQSLARCSRSTHPAVLDMAWNDFLTTIQAQAHHLTTSPPHQPAATMTTSAPPKPKPAPRKART